MNRTIAVLLTAFAVVVAFPLTPAAQTAVKPALTIARFDGAVQMKGSVDEGGDLADAIAAMVEESGCCRVLLRTWMPVATSTRVQSVASLRAGATAAGVEYLVIGTVSRRSRYSSYSAGPPAPIGIGASSFGPFASRNRSLRQAPMPIRTVSTVVTTALRVIDVASGETVRTLQVEHVAPNRSQPAPPVSRVAAPHGALGAILTVAALHHQSTPASDGVVTSSAPDVADALVRSMAQIVRATGGVR